MINIALKTGIIGLVLSLAVVFIFSWSFYEVHPFDVGDYFLASLGSFSGTTVEVPENPYNTLAQQLAQKERELDEREQDIMGALEMMEKEERTLLHTILFMVSALFILILLNFYYDYRSRR